MIILLAGNIFFSIHYIENLKAPEPINQTNAQIDRIKTASFLKLFVEKVLKSNGTVSFEDRVQLENDVRQLKNHALIVQWETFVDSKTSKEAQMAAADLMVVIANNIMK
jgi:hypothetical protein